jgi:hypothetical protein
MSLDESPLLAKFPCPCCRLETLDAQAAHEVCPECGWEDDGQGDDDADEIRGGANGPLSLTAYREMYQEALAEAPDRSVSVAEGGVGLWWSIALQQTAAAGIEIPSFLFDDEEDEEDEEGDEDVADEEA